MVKGYRPEEGGKWNGSNLCSMRETAFGMKTKVEIHQITTRADCMRDDEKLLKEAQEIGLSLDEIKELLTGEGGAEKCRRVSELLRAKLNELDQRIKSMQSFRLTLAHHLAACERELSEKGAAAECPVIMEIEHADRRSTAVSAGREKRR